MFAQVNHGLEEEEKENNEFNEEYFFNSMGRFLDCLKRMESDLSACDIYNQRSKQDMQDQFYYRLKDISRFCKDAMLYAGLSRDDVDFIFPEDLLIDADLDAKANKKLFQKNLATIINELPPNSPQAVMLKAGAEAVDILEIDARKIYDSSSAGFIKTNMYAVIGAFIGGVLGVALGAVLGAGVGSGIGAAVGSASGAVLGAKIGATIGLIGGAVKGYYFGATTANTFLDVKYSIQRTISETEKVLAPYLANQEKVKNSARHTLDDV